MVKFICDDEVDKLNPFSNSDNLLKLITYLTGNDSSLCEISSKVRNELDKFLSKVRSIGVNNIKISYEEFNELLLLLNQGRVEKPFYTFFFTENYPINTIEYLTFKAKPIILNQVKNGVKKFRGYAMLCYGNYRFAFRRLSIIKDYLALLESLDPWCRNSKYEKDQLINRTNPLIPLSGSGDEIPGKNTWLLGYLSSEQLKSDIATLKSNLQIFANSLRKRTPDETVHQQARKFISLGAYARKISDTQKSSEILGIRNTLKYLTWDYLDIYVATSMRHKWEYEETHDFINKVFKHELNDLKKIRWFDPTQSYTHSTIDKGLVEALMLKRARCTIYMAQESETLGKDSELAATLAQGKPVIAYVKEIKDSALKQFVVEIERRPLKYIQTRLTTLIAEDFFDKEDNLKAVVRKAKLLGVKIDSRDLPSYIYDATHKILEFMKEKEYLIISKEEIRIKKKNKNEIMKVCKILAASEIRAYDNRANTIKSKHPLSMQVHLETGVANGIIVVRNAKTCAKLVRGILLRDLQFNIENITLPIIQVDGSKKQQKIATALIESETDSRFRIVTEDKCLSNSFWNFYLSNETN